MSKATTSFALLALASSGLALGLWISQPEDLSRRVTELEAKLRDAQATIVKLKRQDTASTAGSGFGSGSSPAGRPSASAQMSAPAMAGGAGLGSGQVIGEATPPGDAQTGVPAVAVGPQDARTLKKLAEAEARYSDLIGQFQLGPQEKEFFKQLAAKRSDIRRETSIKLQDPTLTAAQRQAIYADGRRQMDQSDQAIGQFLNNKSDYDSFIGWEQSEVERGQMEVGRAIFDNNQTPLSPEQEDWLVKSLVEQRKDSRGLADPYNLQSMSGTKVDPAYIRNVLAKYDQDTAVLTQNARSRFSQGQLESLAAFRTQMRVQVESRLWNMARTTGG